MAEFDPVGWLHEQGFQLDIHTAKMVNALAAEARRRAMEEAHKALWLRQEKSKLGVSQAVLLIEVAEHDWVELIRETEGGPYSHIIEPAGIAAAPQITDAPGVAQVETTAERVAPASSVPLTEEQIQQIRSAAIQCEHGSIDGEIVVMLCDLALAGLRAKNKESKDG